MKGYNYSQAGLYFITICIKGRVHLFGEIGNGIMRKNEAGEMIEKWYSELENKFPDIKCYEKIVMPNHFHCIVKIVETDLPVGADQSVGADLCVCPDNLCVCPDNEAPPTLGEHAGSPLHRVVQWFKTMTTNEYIRGVKTRNWQRFDGKLWQRNYWEHIIRSDKSYHAIHNYIVNNPSKWREDKLR